MLPPWLLKIGSSLIPPNSDRAGDGDANSAKYSSFTCSLWQVALVIPSVCSNLRRGFGTPPRQTGVYVPRRLSHVSGPVTGASCLRGNRLGSFSHGWWAATSRLA